MPAAVENDVNTAAIAESRIGAAQGIRDFVFLAVGTGIGAGIVLNGRLFHGMNWSAGEIGYMLVPGTSVKPDGKWGTGSPREYRRRRGHQGAMAEASGAKIVHSFRKTWSPPRYLTTRLPGDALSADGSAKVRADPGLRDLQPGGCPQLPVVCVGWQRRHASRPYGS